MSPSEDKSKFQTGVIIGTCSNQTLNHINKDPIISRGSDRSSELNAHNLIRTFCSHLIDVTIFFFQFEINGLMPSSVHNDGGKPNSTCSYAENATSTGKTRHGRAWWGIKKNVGGKPSVEGRLMAHILYLERDLRDCTAWKKANRYKHKHR